MFKQIITERRVSSRGECFYIQQIFWFDYSLARNYLNLNVKLCCKLQQWK